MGKVITPAYRVEYKANGSYLTAGTWRVKAGFQPGADGKPNAANLEKHVAGYNASFQIGGVNEHISKSLGFILYIYAAKIVHQASGRVVAEWNAPAFAVV